MKKLVLSFFTLLLFLSAQIKAQAVVSYCVANDSVLSFYKDDADRLTLKRITQVNSSYKDSVQIPKLWSDTVMNALIAVYNATSLPARNDVVNTYNIHAFPNPSLNIFDIAADSNLIWMHQLRNNIIPTGYTRIDNLISNYHLHLNNYDTYSNFFAFHVVYFQSDSNYNTAALVTFFDSVPGVSYGEVNNTIGDGNNIQSTIYPTFVELIYSYGWGDCESGCISRHYWSFHIYYDCSVEFMGDYGAPVSTTTGIQINNQSTISIYPNPANNKITIDASDVLDVKLFDVLGKQIISTKENQIDVSNFNDGVYFIQVQTKQNTTTQKIIVQH